MKHIRFHRIPIYDLRLWVGVGDSEIELERDLTWAFGKPDGEEGTQGMCLSHRSKFAVLFEVKSLCHSLIAHEVHHCTSRMMNHASNRHNVNHDEPYAFLCGFVTELVYCDLKAWRVPVRLKMGLTPVRYVKP